MKKIQQAAALVSLVAVSMNAHAQLATGTQAVDTFKTWFFVILASLAVIYLGAKGVQLATDKIQWADYGQCIMKTAVVGGSTAIAGWAFFLWAA
jgi:hypothetical protein